MWTKQNGQRHPYDITGRSLTGEQPNKPCALFVDAICSRFQIYGGVSLWSGDYLIFISENLVSRVQKCSAIFVWKKWIEISTVSAVIAKEIPNWITGCILIGELSSAQVFAFRVMDSLVLKQPFKWFKYMWCTLLLWNSKSRRLCGVYEHRKKKYPVSC